MVFQMASTVRRRNLKTKLYFRPSVHTKPSRKRAFSKAFFKPEELQNAGFRFRVDGKHFENGAFRNRWRNDNHVIPMTEFSSKHKFKVTGDCCVVKFFRRSVDGNI